MRPPVIIVGCVLCLVCPACETDITTPALEFPDFNAPLVQITSPTDEATYHTGCDSVQLRGRATVNRDEYRCCPPEDDTTVEWSNAATGDSGTANSSIMGDFMVSREWSADVPLAAGSNGITVGATYLGGGTGSDALTVVYDPTSSCP